MTTVEITTYKIIKSFPTASKGRKKVRQTSITSLCLNVSEIYLFSLAFNKINKTENYADIKVYFTT